VTGIFGMNFRHMTVLEKGWGYPAALGLMAAMAAAMLVFFKRKGWF
jgi:magnesium transporter